MTALAAVTVPDAADVWADLGFALDDGEALVGGVAIRFGGPASVTAVGDGPADVGGLPFAWTPEPAPEGDDHPNGVVALDHVVIATPDLERTTEALQRVGFELRRVRDEARQAFLLAGPTILEVTESGRAPAAFFWGLAFAADLDTLVATVGDRVSEPRDAVQPGRRIATLRPSANSSVPIAFLSPRAE